MKQISDDIPMEPGIGHGLKVRVSARICIVAQHIRVDRP